MPNRISLFVSAVLSSLALILTLSGIALAANDCLESPNKSTPSGGHWYYHLERGTQRKCWYFADEAAKSEANKSDAAKSVAAKSEAADSEATNSEVVKSEATKSALA